MKTLHLQFANEAEASSVLLDFLGTELILDIIGITYSFTGEGEDMIAIPLPGWHVNVLENTLPEALVPFQVFPISPTRVFAVDHNAEDPVIPGIPPEAEGVISVTMGQCRLALYDLHNIKTDEEFYTLADILPEQMRDRAKLELLMLPPYSRPRPIRNKAPGQLMRPVAA